MEAIVLDDDSELLLQWQETDWIRQKKTYPRDLVPPVVLAARRQVLAIPVQEASNIFPSSQMSAADFTKLDFPSQTRRMIFEIAGTTYNNNPPTETLSAGTFRARQIPPQDYIEKLEKTFGQAWFDGACSIVDSNYKQSRVPLYTLTYWQEMSRLLEKHKSWRVAQRWVTRWASRTSCSDLATAVQQLLKALPWGGRLRALGAATTTDTLAVLAERARRDPVRATKVSILTLAFQHSVLAAYGGTKPTAEPGPFLERLKRSLLEESNLKAKLYFPVNLDNKHWIAFCVDLENKSLSYGDSLKAPSAKTKPSDTLRRLLKAIQSWARREFKITLRNDGNTLTHGVQTDSSSCGICTVNTIAHNALGDRIYVQERSARHRMEYFIVLGNAHLDYQENDVQAKTRVRPRADSGEACDRPRKRAAHIQDLDTGTPVVASSTTRTSTVVSESAFAGSSFSERAASPELPASVSLPPSSPKSSFQSSLSMRSSPCGSIDLPESPYLDTSSMACSDVSMVPPSVLSLAATSLASRSSSDNFSLALDDEDAGASDSESAIVAAQGKEKPSSLKGDQGPGQETSGSSGGPVGISRSATEAHQIKVSLADGSFKINPKNMDRFLTELALLDPLAEVREDRERRWQVWHSRCGKWYTMKGPKPSTAAAKDGDPTPLQQVKGVSAKIVPVLRTSTMLSWANKLGWKKGEKVRGDDEAQQVSSEASRTLGDEPEVEARRHERPLLQVSVSAPSHASWDHESVGTLPRRPCSGLTANVDERIPVYLRRTFVSAAGSRSVTVIAQELYEERYRNLSTEEKELVDGVQHHECTWRNEHLCEAVFATSCKKFYDTPSYGASPSEVSLCSECYSVLRSPAFMNALRNAANRTTVRYKHINKKFQNETLGHLFARSHGLEPLVTMKNSDASAFFRLASGILEGGLAGYPIVGDLMRALSQDMDRETRGVGRQNFKYGPALMQFAHMCSIISPELYRILNQHLPLPTLRHLRRSQNATPQFPLGVCDKTFDTVERYLQTVNYSGPVALSCDDTKLHAAFRTYWDASQQTYMLVGGSGEPRAVANEEELQQLLSDASITKATKIRVWCLQVPLPKVPPIIIAARAIPNSLTVPDLHDLFKPILDGLLAREIPVCSYACDGTETERSLQRLLIRSADYQVTYVVPHPLGSHLEPHVIVIAFYQGHAIVMIQDSKHALKTYRNNLFSGARLLVLGNDVAMYGWARLLAFLEDSPLYNRDIEKVDRQDDNAATRLFSATTLEYLTSHHPDRVAQIVYLFVLGELVDAYQNRHISHLERVKMALRARFFLNTWRAYLKAAQYPEARYFISREAADISNILIDGLIGLIIVYRDYLGQATPTPLCPWLHSSEVCEHVFGECRKLVKDFTFLDFIYMVPRLHILLRSIIKFAQSSDPKARASGYSHSYFDTDNIDLRALADFPSDDEIQQAARDAWEEAESLFSILGIVPTDFLSSPPAPTPAPAPTFAQPAPAPPTGSTPVFSLPSIAAWCPEDPLFDLPPAHPDMSSTVTPAAPAASSTAYYPADEYESYFSDEDEDSDDDDYGEDETAELQRLIDTHQHDFGRSHADDERFLNLTCAAVALAMDDTVTAQTASSIPEDVQAQQYDDDRREIQQAFEAAANALLKQLPPETARPSDKPSASFDNMDYSSLNTMRRQHETKRSARCARSGRKPVDEPFTDAHAGDEDKDTSKPARPSRRLETIRQMEALVRQQDGLEQGVGTGLERKARWEGAKKETGGNSANAALAAGQRAAAVLKQRLNAFAKHAFPGSLDLADALIGPSNPQKPHHSPLAPGSYGFIYADSRILVGRVLAIYSRDGGKNGKHSWRESVPHIGHVSYIAVQLYEHVRLTQFRAILRRMAPFQTLTFALIPSDAFLRLLPGAHQTSPDGRTLTLDSAVQPFLQQLQKPEAITKLALALALLKGSRRKSKKNQSPGDVADGSGSENGD